MVLGCLLWFWRDPSPKENPAPLGLLAGILLVEVFTVPWLFLLIPLVMSLTLVVLAALRPEEKLSPKAGWWNRGVLYVAGVGLIIASLILRTDWLPMENIVFTDHSRMVGRFVGEESGWATILDEGDAVRIVASSSVASREVCEGLASIGSRDRVGPHAHGVNARL